MRSRMRHGRSIDRGRLVSSILHGLANAGFDLSEVAPTEIAAAIARRIGHQDALYAGGTRRETSMSGEM